MAACSQERRCRVDAPLGNDSAWLIIDPIFGTHDKQLPQQEEPD